MSGYVGSRAPEVRRELRAAARLSGLMCSREQTADALARNLGTVTEQDWRAQLARADRRLAEHLAH